MPIYEFRCRDCGRTTSVLIRSLNQAFDPRCAACGGANLVKLVSRVAVRRSAGGPADEWGGGAGEDFDEGVDDVPDENGGGADDLNEGG
ncbi:MAG: zinc ribbon domain-containing protein [Candidatus Aminicenantes bacterium]|nr:zinc ribbon domain-containing protein [Candidatus Aminicenantes bacterium]